MSNFPKKFFRIGSTPCFLLTWHVLRAVDNNRFVALLAIAGTSFTKPVVFDPPLAVDEHAHFEPLFFAHSRHTLALLKK